jgi:hypothetical protein
MSSPGDAAGTARQAYSWLLAILAWATLLYPLVFLAALYGEWLLAWYVLGRRPRPMLDDPQLIPGSGWLYGITFAGMLMILPMGCGAGLLNILHLAINRPRWLSASLQLILFLVVWVGGYGLLRWDPWSVMDWYLD